MPDSQRLPASSRVPSTDIATRNNEPAAFRGEASAGAVLRHDLHYVSDVQCVCIRQVNKIKGSCCPQGRGANSEGLA